MHDMSHTEGGVLSGGTPTVGDKVRPIGKLGIFLSDPVSNM